MTFTVREHLDGNFAGKLLLASTVVDRISDRIEIIHCQKAYMLTVQHLEAAHSGALRWNIATDKWWNHPATLFVEYPYGWMRARERRFADWLCKDLQDLLDEPLLSVTARFPTFDRNGNLSLMGEIFVSIGKDLALDIDGLPELENKH